MLPPNVCAVAAATLSVPAPSAMVPVPASAGVARLNPPVSSVPPLTVSPLTVPNDEALVPRSVPPFTVIVPVRVLAPLSTHVAGPELIRLPVPEIMPDRVLSAPVKPPPSVRLPASDVAPLSVSAPVRLSLLIMPLTIDKLRLLLATPPV